MILLGFPKAGVSVGGGGGLTSITGQRRELIAINVGVFLYNHQCQLKLVLLKLGYGLAML